MNIAINNKVPSSYKVSIFYLILLFIVAGAGWFTTRYLGDKARKEILQFNESTILIHSSHLTGEFEHIERDVRVLSGSPLIAPALISRKDEDVANANSVLDRYNSTLGTSVSYLLDSNGTAIASSNRNDPDSFVGISYGFRPYFVQAMQDAPGRYFALGITSLKRGFFASYPVKDRKGQIIGVVVIKKDIDEKETGMSRYPYFFLVDPNGIIFLSSRKDMTFKSLWPISRETRLALLESGQFGKREFDTVLPREIVDGMEIKFDGRNYLASRKVINPEGWSTVIMTSTERILQYQLAGVIITLWICTLILIPMIINYWTSRSEHALQLSESRLRRAEVVALFGNWEFILGFDKVKASEGARIIYGLEGAEWSILEVQKIPLPEYRGMLDEALSGLVEEGKPYNVEYKIRRPSDGKIIDIHSIAEYSPEKRVVFGVIQDITDRKRADEALLESNARISHLNDVLRAIRDVGSLINREKDPIELLNAVCHSLVQTRSYVMVWIGKPEADSKQVLMVAHSGGGADLLRHAPITWDDSPTGQGPAGTAIRERRVVVFDDLATDPRFALWRDPVMSYGGASIASVPLIHQDRLFGVLTVKADRKNAFDVEEVELLSNLAAELARALQSLENEAARKRAEEALHESELRLRTILQTANEGFWLIDNDTVTTDLNPRMCAILGRNREAVFGRKIFDFVDSENKAIFEQQIGLRGQGEVGAYEIALSRPDGSNVLCQFNSTPLFDESGNKVGSFAMVTDISARKRAEIALRMSEERFSRFFRSSPVGTSILRLNDNKFVDVNDVFLGLFGYTREELIGQNPLDLGIWVDPEDRVKMVEILQRQSRVKDFETQFRWKSGEIGNVLFSAEVIEVAGEQYLLGLAHDITERKRAEEERRRLEDRLQRAEKMEALGTLAGGVAHDLNNVLGVVVGYSELLLLDLGEPSSVKSRAEAILKGGLRAAAIVQDLLTLARRGVSNRKVLNFNNIVLECQNSPEFTGISSYHPNIRLKTDLEANLLNISGSAVHLSKSLINLVSNAAEAMPEGGVITIKTVNQYLDKPVSGYDEVREGDYVVLSVSDTGQGIPANDLKRIFEPFYTKKVMGRSGTGLGLAVIWGTVIDHLGYINVDSQEGKGTIFTLYFPVTREEISQEQVSISAAEYMGKGESILIVDDVKEQRELAGMMLTKLNYNVVSVSSGEEAVEYLKQNAVDLVILDMIMDPGMDGLDTYAKILEIHTHQRAIIVSGFSETKRVSRAQALGAGTYVKKPYVLENLGLAVRIELDRPA